MNTDQSTHIDATGLTCPMPLMLLKKAITELAVGDQVIIDVTDVHAELDFEIWCERFGHQLEKTSHSDDVMCYSVVKGRS